MIGGQRSRTEWANFSPSMLPGMLISVKSKVISVLDSSRITASSGPALNRNETGFLDDLDGEHPQQRFILHHQYDWLACARWVADH